MSNVVALVPAATPLVPQDQVTSSRLSQILEAAYFDCVTEDDGAIYITEGIEFPVWLTIDSEDKYLVMFTYVDVPDASSENWLERVNELNVNFALPQFMYARSAVWGRYWLSYDGGLNIRHFVKMLRRFSGAFRSAVTELAKKSR